MDQVTTGNPMQSIPPPNVTPNLTNPVYVTGISFVTIIVLACIFCRLDVQPWVKNLLCNMGGLSSADHEQFRDNNDGDDGNDDFEYF